MSDLKIREPQIIQVPAGWVSVEEAADMLKVQPGSIHVYVSQNLLRKGYILDRMFISVASIEEYKEKHNGKKGRPKKATSPAQESE